MGHAMRPILVPLACAGLALVPLRGQAATVPGIHAPAASAAIIDVANARNPYGNVDHRNDAGNDTGDNQVDQLNNAQLDQNYRGPYRQAAPPPGAYPPAAYAPPPPPPGAYAPRPPIGTYPPPPGPGAYPPAPIPGTYGPSSGSYPPPPPPPGYPPRY
jgi:hypothetical protein